MNTILDHFLRSNGVSPKAREALARQRPLWPCQPWSASRSAGQRIGGSIGP